MTYSNVPTLASALYRSAKTGIRNWADAMRAAWAAVKANRFMLTNGKAVLIFAKATGEVVERTGRAVTDGVRGCCVLFIDVNDNDQIKSFRADRFVGFHAA